MPKKKGKSTTKILLVVVVVAIVTVGVVAWHDGLVGVTPIEDINDFSIDNGTVVTVKGEVTIILGSFVTVADSTGAIGFTWADADSLTLHEIVVVRGTVSSFITLADVSSVAPVWLFA